MSNYSINVVWSDEDECFIATVPEFPGLSAFGESREEAIKEAEIVLNGFIEVYNEDGSTLPEPIKHTTYSGQTRLRLPKRLHAALSGEAKREGVSLNTYIVSLLSSRRDDSRLDRLAHELHELKNQMANLRIPIDAGR